MQKKQKYESDYFQRHYDLFIQKLNSGSIFIYPTDTIYGIGCDALNTHLVNTIRDLKHRPEKPFSIIAPSKEWILDHFFVPSSVNISSKTIVRGEIASQILGEKTIHPLDLLPGKFTLILEPKQSFLSDSISKNNKVGVRIPDHFISDFVANYHKPIVTTSVNMSGKPNLTSYTDLESADFGEIRAGVDFFVNAGILAGSSSVVIDCTL